MDRDADPPIAPHRRERLKRALRTIDGRQSGASHRAIATAFFGADRVAAEPWTDQLTQGANLAAGRLRADDGRSRLSRSPSRGGAPRLRARFSSIGIDK
ncbi:DNA -binding domain-containing protein [Nitratireductor sp. GCM10026969]|uniref:DNA -binding domain-containing protein n=1 Tax=Nitratireductor sp. GCM10026969 TaxID=3252645 RepID=UPI00360B1CDF